MVRGLSLGMTLPNELPAHVSILTSLPNSYNRANSLKSMTVEKYFVSNPVLSLPSPDTQWSPGVLGDVTTMVPSMIC